MSRIAAAASSCGLAAVLVLVLMLVLVACAEAPPTVPVDDGEPPAADEAALPCDPAAIAPPEGGRARLKVLLALDTSGSMQLSDPADERFAAVERLLDELAAEERALVEVALLGFGAAVRSAPAIGPSTTTFFTAPSTAGRPDFLAHRDAVSDLEGGLDVAQRIFKADMMSVDPAERARSVYVALFLSDGAGFFHCCGAGAETVGAYGYTGSCALPSPSTDTRYCDAEVEIQLCDDDEHLALFRESEQSDPARPDFGDGPLPLLHAFELGSDYNRAGTLAERAAGLAGLVDELGVREVRVHFAYLDNVALDDYARSVFGMNRCLGEELFAALALAGNGSTTTFDAAEQVDLGAVLRQCPAP